MIVKFQKDYISAKVLISEVWRKDTKRVMKITNLKKTTLKNDQKTVKLNWELKKNMVFNFLYFEQLLKQTISQNK